MVVSNSMQRLMVWLFLGMVLAVLGLWLDSRGTRREYDFVRGGYTCELCSAAGHATLRLFRNEPEDEYMKEFCLPYGLALLGLAGTAVTAHTVWWAIRKRRQGRGFPVETHPRP